MSWFVVHFGQIVFYCLAVCAVAGAVGVVAFRNPVHAALSLLGTFLAVAGLFILMHAEFLAAVQILVYAGGIMVLFLFVIMLVNLERTEKEKPFNKQWLVGVAAALALGAMLVGIYVKGRALFPEQVATLPESQNTQTIGLMLYGNYMFAFEIASLLLLVAIIGAVVMAKKRI